jgi:hypothetical protein
MSLSRDDVGPGYYRGGPAKPNSNDAKTVHDYIGALISSGLNVPPQVIEAVNRLLRRAADK